MKVPKCLGSGMFYRLWLSVTFIKKDFFSEYLMEVRSADNNHCTGICEVHVPQMLPTPSATAVGNPASVVGVLVST